MSSEWVVNRDLDQCHRRDMKAARNKRKMTRPKRMLPRNSASAESSHFSGNNMEEKVGVELENEQHSNGPWNLDDTTEIDHPVAITLISGQPLDLRSSTEHCDGAGTEGWFRSYPFSAETSNLEMNDVVEEKVCKNATKLSADPIATEIGYLCNAVTMDAAASGDVSAVETSGDDTRGSKGYKHMSRQRRIEANARERSRVHTISAAFESLRRAVPSYAYNQRLSKLAILRIACSYIVALARLADLDYSHEQDAKDFGECVDLCTRTIQAEGRAKRRQ